MLDIKNIPRNMPKNEYFKIKYSELDANVFEDGHSFCATDGEWCCVGVVVDYVKNVNNPDPLLQVNQIYNVVKDETVDPEYVIKYGINKIDSLDILEKVLNQVIAAIPNCLFTDILKADLKRIMLKHKS